MPYRNHFKLVDDLVVQLDPVVAGLTDPFLASRYAGFLAVSAVTVYELAIKTIFIGYAESHHVILGCMARSIFSRINGRIKTTDITQEYLPRFGDKYVERFKRLREGLESKLVRTKRISITSSYANIIVWRNEFAHGGHMPQNATYDDVKKAYEAGKHIIHCLSYTFY